MHLPAATSGKEKKIQTNEYGIGHTRVHIPHNLLGSLFYHCNTAVPTLTGRDPPRDDIQNFYQRTVDYHDSRNWSPLLYHGLASCTAVAEKH